MKLNRYVSMALATALICSNASNVIAATGSTQVNLEVINTTVEPEPEPEPIAVKVPAELELEMDKTGSIEVKGSNAIENLSEETSISLTGIEVDGVNNWEVVDYGTNLSSEVKGTKKLGIQVNGNGTTSTGEINLTEGDYTISPKDTLPIDIEVKMPKQDKSSKTKIAVMNYTFEAVDDSLIESNVTNNWSGDAVLVNTQHIVEINTTSTLSTTDDILTIADIEVSNPDIVDVVKSIETDKMELIVTPKAIGEAVITVKLSNDTATSFTVETFDIDRAKLVDNIAGTKDNDTEIQIGDTLRTGDIYINLPIINKDKQEETIKVYPEFEDYLVESATDIINGNVIIDGEEIAVQVKVNAIQRSEIVYELNQNRVITGGNIPLSITVSSEEGLEAVDRIEYGTADIIDIQQSPVNTENSLTDNTIGYTITGLSKGSTNVVVYLKNGDSINFDITVYDLGDTSNLVVENSFNEGDSISTGDIELSIPILVGDSGEVLEIIPTFDTKELQLGENIITGTIVIDNKEIEISFIVNANELIDSGVEVGDSADVGDTEVEFPDDTTGTEVEFPDDTLNEETGVTNETEEVTTTDDTDNSVVSETE